MCAVRGFILIKILIGHLRIMENTFYAISSAIQIRKLPESPLKNNINFHIRKGLTPLLHRFISVNTNIIGSMFEYMY